MLLIFVVLALGIGSVLYAVAGRVSNPVERANKTAIALATAKQALIGWSAARTPQPSLPNARPGELPCPDNTGDGFEDGSCVAGKIGRLPWKTLGIPEPKDDAGETLWYAISDNFRIWNLTHTELNSDTRGNLVVYAGTTGSSLTSEAVAVIFAPGAALGAQIRDTTQALCATTGTTIARNLCPANYLDLHAVSGVNNAVTGGPFIQAPSSDQLNDRLVVITTVDLMPLVEQRVAREMLTALKNYKTQSACNCYPWPDSSGGGSSTEGINRGRIPITASPKNWGTANLPQLPDWFSTNKWNQVIYYAVAKNSLENGGAACTSCVDPTLTIGVRSGLEVVLLTPGPAGIGRPLAYPFSNWSAYLDDNENSDNSNDRYVVPSSTAYARDRIFDVP